MNARRAHLARIAYAVCGDPHRAEDLVQTALVKLYVARPRIRRQGAEEAYARRIIVRADIDESRRPWRRESPGLDGLDHPVAEGVSVEDRSELFDALQALPPTQRRCVLLRHWLGLPVAETAAELRISERTGEEPYLPRYRRPPGGARRRRASLGTPDPREPGVRHAHGFSASAHAEMSAGSGHQGW